MADLDTGLAALDERFLDLARSGDERANHVQTALSRLRSELESLSTATASQDNSLDGLAAAYRSGFAKASTSSATSCRARWRRRLGEAEAGAARLLASAEAARPHVELDARCRDRGRQPDRVRRVQRRCAAGTACRADDVGRPGRQPGRAAAGRTQRRHRRGGRRSQTACPAKPARRWSPRWSRSAKPPAMPPSAPAKRSARSFRKAPAN